MPSTPSHWELCKTRPKTTLMHIPLFLSVSLSLPVSHSLQILFWRERQRTRQRTHKHTRKYAYAHTASSMTEWRSLTSFPPYSAAPVGNIGSAYTDNRPLRCRGFQPSLCNVSRGVCVQAVRGVHMWRRRALPVAACVGASLSALLSLPLSASEGDKHILND